MKEQQKKYELTDEFIEIFGGKKLYRIKALVSFGVVVAGQLGGFIESEKNLDQSLSSNAWVSGDARVSGDAGVGVAGLLHGGQVLDPGAYVDTHIGPARPPRGAPLP